MNSHKYFIISLIFVSTLLFILAFNIKFIEHDDMITIIAATGNLENYDNNDLSGRFVDVVEWQKLWQLKDFGIFQKISIDLARFDIHPPLYFWFVHIFIYLFQHNYFYLYLINILTFIFLTISFFYLLSSYINFKQNLFYIIFIWIFSGANLNVIFILRQYLLSGLFIIVSTLLVHKILIKSKNKYLIYLIFLFLFFLLGLLTNYQFNIFLILIVLYSIIFLYLKRNFLKLIFVLIVTFSSYLAFYIIHPLFYLSFQRQGFQAENFNIINIPYRIYKSFLIIIGQFAPSDLFHYLFKNSKIWLVVLIGLILFIAFIYLFIKYKIPTKFFKLFTQKVFYDQYYLPTFMFTTLYLTYSLLYIVHKLPQHSMNFRYVFLFVPFLFILLGQFFDKISVQKKLFYKKLFIFIFILQIINFGYTFVKKSSEQVEEHLPANITGIKVVLLDSTKRGSLPRVLRFLPPNTKVYAANQDEFIDKFLLPDNIKELYYFSDTSLEQNQLKLKAILEYLKNRGYSVSKVQKKTFASFNMIVLKK